jgi:hypothetical protein
MNCDHGLACIGDRWTVPEYWLSGMRTDRNHELVHPGSIAIPLKVFEIGNEVVERSIAIDIDSQDMPSID